MPDQYRAPQRAGFFIALITPYPPSISIRYLALNNTLLCHEWGFKYLFVHSKTGNAYFRYLSLTTLIG